MSGGGRHALGPRRLDSSSIQETGSWLGVRQAWIVARNRRFAQRCTMRRVESRHDHAHKDLFQTIAIQKEIYAKVLNKQKRDGRG